MTVQAYILMTQTQRDEATALDDNQANLGAREIDNPLANNLGIGQLVGKWIVSARVLNTPEYGHWVPLMSSWPIHVFDSVVMFSPVTDV
jgi:hypothetical protein